MIKRIITLLIALSLILSVLPVMTLAEEEYFFKMLEAEDLYTTFDTTWIFQRINDYEASGGYTMQAGYINGTFDGGLRLYYDDLEVEKSGKYKLFVRTKGSDSIKHSVNGGTYKTVWTEYNTEGYTWRYLGEIDLYSYDDIYNDPSLGNEWEMNTISFAPHKGSTYFDKLIITDNPLYYPTGMGQDPSESSGFSDHYPKPSLYPKKGEHPRLFINKNDIETIRSNLNHEKNQGAYERVLYYAGRNYTGVTSSYSNSYVECAKANALLYLLDKDEAKAKKAIDIMLNYMETVKYPPGSLLEFRDLGLVIVAASIVYDWCHDAEYFTDELKSKLAHLCMKQANKLECGWPPTMLTGLSEGHGQENSVMRDMFSFAVAVYDEFPEIYDFVGGRVFSQYIPYANFRYRNGDISNSQGDNYGVYRFPYELYMTLILRGMGYTDVINKNQRLMAYQQIIRSRPDGGTFQDGDIYDRAVTGDKYKWLNPSIASAFYGAVLYDDPYLMGYFREICPDPYSYLSTGGELSYTMYLALNKPEIEEKSYDDIPLTVYSGDDTGILTARTSWEETKKSGAMLVSMKLPEIWRANHQHLDAGHFEIYYKGPLALDSGLYNSYGNSHDINYNKRTIAHNCMLVYKEGEHEYSATTGVDGGQRGIVTYPYNITMEDIENDHGKAGEVLALDWGEDMYAPSYTYFKGDLTEWYSDKVSDYKRSFMFLNLNDKDIPGALIVFDRITSSSKNYKKTWLLHTQQEPDTSSDIITAVRDTDGYNGKLMCEPLLPKERTITKIGGEGYEYYYGGVNYVPQADDAGKGLDESGKWRVEISPAEANRSDVFLNVLTVCDANSEIKPLKAELLENDLFYGVKIKDRISYFNKSDTNISSNFTLTFEGDGEYEVVVTGLKDGKWTVKSKDNEIVRDVTKKGTTLSFKGKSGTYELSYEDKTVADKDLSFTASLFERNAPFIEAHPHVYRSVDGITAVYAKSMFDYGYDVKEYGFAYVKNEDDTLDSPGAMKFKSDIELNMAGQFGVGITDREGKLGKSFILKPYIIYVDNGVEKTVYGSPVYSK